MNLIVTPVATPDGPLEGRVLVLNTAKAARFQCWGFSVTRNSPIQVVPRQCAENKLRDALRDNILLDMTDDPGSMLALNKSAASVEAAVKAGTLTKINEEDSSARAFIGNDGKGNCYVIIPKDDDDYERMRAEIAETGRLRVEKPKLQEQLTGLTSIYEEELPAPEQQG